MRYKDKRNGKICEALVITDKTIGDDIVHFTYPKIKSVGYDGNTFIISLNDTHEYLSAGDVLIKYRTYIDVLYKEEFEENFESVTVPFKGGEKVYTNKEVQKKLDDRISIDLTFNGEFAIRKISEAIKNM